MCDIVKIRNDKFSGYLFEIYSKYEYSTEDKLDLLINILFSDGTENIKIKDNDAMGNFYLRKTIDSHINYGFKEQKNNIYLIVLHDFIILYEQAIKESFRQGYIAAMTEKPVINNTPAIFDESRLINFSNKYLYFIKELISKFSPECASKSEIMKITAFIINEKTLLLFKEDLSETTIEEWLKLFSNELAFIKLISKSIEQIKLLIANLKYLLKKAVSLGVVEFINNNNSNQGASTII